VDARVKPRHDEINQFFVELEPYAQN